MASKNVETMRAAHESWNRRDFEGTANTVAPTISYTDYARGVGIKTREEFKNFVTGWAQAFPDGKITEASYIDAGDTVVAQFTAAGTNDGPFGPFPATGRPMSLQFCEVARFDASGQVISGGIYYDQFTLLTQLGHTKQAAAAGR